MEKVESVALETEYVAAGGVHREGGSKMGILSPSDWEAEVLGK